MINVLAGGLSLAGFQVIIYGFGWSPRLLPPTQRRRGIHDPAVNGLPVKLSHIGGVATFLHKCHRSAEPHDEASAALYFGLLDAR